ncbi:acyltransferase family protein [Shimia sp.]|uniref:acyltransferase family protein n=1 Tax=Shimia sp. TaxID=1954381 RepID=UPI003BAB5B0A
MRPGRLEYLDAARFCAAVSVFLYHLLYVHHGELSEVFLPFKYGIWGVMVFFVISGFVIGMSVEGSTAKMFVLKRVKRLYPAYWVSIAFVVVVAAIVGEVPDALTTIVNLTMLQEFLGFEHINGVFWTLTFELLFYFYILCGVFILKINIRTFNVLWILALCVAHVVDIDIVRKLILGSYAIYFVFGLQVMLIFKERKLIDWVVLVFILGLLFFYSRENLQQYSVYLSDSMGFLGLFKFVFIFLLFSYGFQKILPSKVAYLGEISYPLYLVHPFAMVLSNYFFDNWLDIFVSTFLSFTVSALVLISERHLRSLMNKLI